MRKTLLMMALVAIVFAASCKKEPQAPKNGVENGHEWVDLGLPSGLLWATCNVGAATPEVYGDYFAWGETTPKSSYTWGNYKYDNSPYTNGWGEYLSFTKYCSQAEYGYNGFTDNLITLQPEDDAATVNWGGAWRMPTVEELRELRDNCTHQWTTQNGVNGHLFTSLNGNTLFLPAAASWYGDDSSQYVGTEGSCLSSSLNTDNPTYCWCFSFHLKSYSVGGYSSRYAGHTVRPVCSLSQK